MEAMEVDGMGRPGVKNTKHPPTNTSHGSGGRPLFVKDSGLPRDHVPLPCDVGHSVIKKWGYFDSRERMRSASSLPPDRPEGRGAVRRIARGVRPACHGSTSW